MSKTNDTDAKKKAAEIQNEKNKKLFEESEEYLRHLAKKALEFENLLKKQDVAKLVSDLISAMNEQFNLMAAELVEPLTAIVPKLEPIPDKIRSTVDIDGAKNGMYELSQKFEVAAKKFFSKYLMSAEVPITLEDFRNDPYKYPLLYLDDMYCCEGISEMDCWTSGYKKYDYVPNYEEVKKLLELFKPVKDRDIVAQQAEKLLNAIFKPILDSIKPPLNTVTSIIPFEGIKEPVDSLILSIVSILDFATMNISEKELNLKLARKKASEKAAEEKRQELILNGLFYDDPSVFSVDKMMNAVEDGIDTMKSYASGAIDGLEEGFANLKPPSLPPEVKALIDDFKDALLVFKDNINNIYIVLIMKLIGLILKCLTEVTDALGVPTVPDPLNRVPLLYADAQLIMEFCQKLPLSLVTLVESIIKKKYKTISVMMQPTVPMPKPNIFPVPPGYKDVITAETLRLEITKEILKQLEEQLKKAAELERLLKEMHELIAKQLNAAKKKEMILKRKEAQKQKDAAWKQISTLGEMITNPASIAPTQPGEDHKLLPDLPEHDSDTPLVSIYELYHHKNKL